MIPHYNIVICTPGDLVYSNYAKSLMSTIQYMNENKITWKWMNESTPHIPKTRSLILNNGYGGNNGFRQFPEEYGRNIWKIFGGEFTYDQIVWIDNDISWSTDAFLRLLQHQEEVVSGVYMFDDNKHAVISIDPGTVLNVEDMIKMNQKQLHEVHTCGMGFMKVRYGVIEQMEHPIFLVHEYEYFNKKLNRMATYKTTDEDSSFCHRVRETGRKVFFDPSIRVSHNKRVLLTPPKD